MSLNQEKLIIKIVSLIVVYMMVCCSLWFVDGGLKPAGFSWCVVDGV